MTTTQRTLIAGWVLDARETSLGMIQDLEDDQLLGPRLSNVNPLLWEIGHIAWFQEKWVLRHALGLAALRRDADTLYDSIAVPHDTRWDLPLPTRHETLQYAIDVRDRVLEHVERRLDRRLAYFVKLAVFHEDMHTEAFTYTRQTLRYPPPLLVRGRQPGGNCPSQTQPGHTARQPAGGRQDAGRGEVVIPGGRFLLGAVAGDEDQFVFDNEKWAHPVTLSPFTVARDATTQAEFAAFVDEGGYERREFWSDDGWQWREAAGARHPVYWRRSASGGGWLRRVFDQWQPLEATQPVMHVNYYEAEAYCRWARRRLPTEPEWELAAAASPEMPGPQGKRPFPWGDAAPTPTTANLDWHAKDTIDVAELPMSDSAFGCRQMIGNVWEWTASVFLPYPGFVPDPYREYSQPWF